MYRLSLRTGNLQIAALLLVLISAPALSQHQEVDDNHVSVTLHYPSEVQAGEHFSVTASLLNTSDEPMLISAYWTLRRNTVSGNHASSYRIFSHPLQEPSSFMRIILEPGVPRTITVREFYYEADELFSGEIVIHDSSMTVSDTTWQRATTRFDTFSVSVAHDDTVTYLNAREVPARQALESRAIVNGSDGPWLVHDPNTGYAWLPLTRTHNQSLLSVLDKLAPGAEFDGFRVANLEEVQTLFLNVIHAAGIYYPDHALFAANEYEDGDLEVSQKLLPVIQKLHEQLGITQAVNMSDHERYSASGILIGTAEVPDAVLSASVFVHMQSERGRFHLGPASEFDVRFSNSSGGVWLLRESNP